MRFERHVSFDRERVTDRKRQEKAEKSKSNRARVRKSTYVSRHDMNEKERNFMAEERGGHT